MSNNPRADHQWADKIRSRERLGDFAYTLSRIEWDVFSTLTFRDPVPRTPVCYGMAWQLVRAVSEVTKVPYNRLLIALRGEYGEAKGRFHFHCLVGGTTTRNTISLCHQISSLWKQIARNPRTDVRQYDTSLAGASYISKCLGANEYEIEKYSFADQVTLSASVTSLIRGIEASGDRRCRELHSKKQGISQLRFHFKQRRLNDEVPSVRVPGLDHPAPTGQTLKDKVRSTLEWETAGCKKDS
jgi:hypothetical protein